MPYGAKTAAMSAFAEELRLSVSGVRRQLAGSRVLYGARFRARDGHSSGRPSPAASSNQPGQRSGRRIQGFLNLEKPCVAPIRSCSRWGLPCCSCCHARGALLPHRFTLALRRFVFCGAFPGVAPAGSYPAPCLRGARTFLHCESGGHPAQAGPIDIGVLSHFVNYRIGNASVVQMPYRDKFRSQNAISGLTRHTG